MAMNPNAILLVSDHHGIFVPAIFTCKVSYHTLSHVNYDDYAAIGYGPDHLEYWEAWESILNTAIVKSLVTGQEYYLWQDGDLWLIPVGEQVDIEEAA